MKTNDVVTQYVYFTQQSGGKTRPVLVVAANDDQFLAYKITTKFQSKSKLVQNRYFKIMDWQAAGLDKLSYVDLYSGTMWLPIAKMQHKLGHLSPSDILRLQQFQDHI